MTTKTKKLAALLMSGIMTLSIAPVVHADDKVELTGMVQQSRWYSGLQSMVEKLSQPGDDGRSAEHERPGAGAARWRQHAHARRAGNGQKADRQGSGTQRQPG